MGVPILSSACTMLCLDSRKVEMLGWCCVAHGVQLDCGGRQQRVGMHGGHPFMPTHEDIKRCSQARIIRSHGLRGAWVS